MHTDALSDQPPSVPGVTPLPIPESLSEVETLRAHINVLQEALDEMEAAQEQLIQQERLRAVGEMASSFSHEISNSLTPIAGFAELLLLRPELLADHERARSYLSLILSAAQEATDTLRRLRELYRYEDGEEPLDSAQQTDVIEGTVEPTPFVRKEQA
jgi:signal transduction histidine kinase